MDPAKKRFAFNIVNKALALSKVKRNVAPTDAKVTSSYLSVVGVGSRVSSPCVTLTVLRGVSRSYYFNLTRTVGRRCTGVGSPIKGIFYTRLSWGSTAECIRMLTYNEVVIKPLPGEKITILGPPDTRSFVDRLFAYSLSSNIYNRFKRIFQFSDDSFYSDENIIIKKVHLNPANAEKNANHAITAAYICTLQQKSTPENHAADTSSSKSSDPDDFGHRLDSFFTVDEAQTVDASFSLDDDEPTVVTANAEPQSTYADSKSPTILVLDCPSIDHFKCLERDGTVSQHFKTLDENAPCFVVHITPRPVLRSQHYQEWMESLGRHCDHIVLNDDNRAFYSYPELAHQATMHESGCEFFPPVNKDLIEELTAGKTRMSRASAGLTFQLSRKTDDTWVGEKVFKSNLSCDLMTRYMPRIRSIQKPSDIQGQDLYPILTVLGSGCSTPTPFRAQPGYLLRLSKKKSILLDCGGQTLLRMYQNFSKSADNILATIKAIFLSHNHLDHHAAFLPVLENILRSRNTRPHLNQEKVACIMPRDMVEFYRSYCERFMPNSTEHTTFIELEAVRTRQPDASEVMENLVHNLGILSMWPIHVEHSEKTFGVCIRTLSGKKIVYSSDTRDMNKKLIMEGQRADILIHDCMIVSDNLRMEAQIRKHSTFSGALATAKAMQAKFLLLNHFAHFYPVVPILSSEIPPEWKGRVACAYDFLSVSLSNVHQLPKLETRLSEVFVNSREYFELQQTRFAKGQLQKVKSVNKLTMLI